MARQLSDTIRSGASMVTYEGMGECAYTMKWCRCRYLRPWAMFDTCVGIFNVIKIWHMSRRTHLVIRFRLTNDGLNYWSTSWLLRHLRQHSRRDTLISMLASNCRSTYVSDTIDGVPQLKLEAMLLSGWVGNKSRQVLGCCIVVSWILRHRKLKSAMQLDDSRAGGATCQLCIVS